MSGRMAVIKYAVAVKVVSVIMNVSTGSKVTGYV